MSLPIVYHPDYMAPLRPNHRFPMSKYGYLREALVARGFLPAAGGYIAPAEAGFQQIAAVHAPGYVDRVFSQTLSRDESRAIGLPDTPAVTRRARLSAAGTLLAARLALEHGLAANAAGGSHHAGPAGGAGYCVFNDVAVAAQALLDEGIARRILIVDLDVHQGDGTALIFAAEPRVFTLSLHGAKNYPTVKPPSDLDLGLEDGTEDAAYLAALSPLLDRALAEAFGGALPDIAFYNAGVDPHRDDRLGRLALSVAGLRARDRAVLARLRAAGIPAVGVIGGGYSDDAAALATRHALLFEEMARISA